MSDAGGSARQGVADGDGLSAEAALRIYRTMATIRSTEDRIVHGLTRGSSA